MAFKILTISTKNDISLATPASSKRKAATVDDSSDSQKLKRARQDRTESTPEVKSKHFSKSSPVKPRERKTEDIIDLDSDEELPKVTTRTRANPPLRSSPRKTAATKKRAVISDLEDDDDDFEMEDDDDIQIIDKTSSKRPTRASLNKPTTPVKAASAKVKSPVKARTPVKKEVKKAVQPETSAGAAAAITSAHTAEDVLKTIEDAVLPESVDTKGMNYFQLKAKQGNVAAPTGVRDIPEGRPNCLNGLTVVFTGVLPNLDRSQCEQLASRYGAKVTKSITKKTTLVVIGEEAGPKKVQLIKQYKTKAIDEEGFIKLISSMPADGGDGEEAKKLLAKKKEEERVAFELAEREDEEEKLRQKKLLAERKKSAKVVVEKPSDKPDSEKLWTVKYAPTKIEQICGNKGNVQKLRTWLENWSDNHRSGFTNYANGGDKRAVLISGPPGIGKTTSAHIVAKSLGFDILERNASDVRSKSLLNQQLKSVLNNTSVVGYFQAKEKGDTGTEGNGRKFVLIMDEVDGMSSGDHGGVGQLAQFCRTTDTPLILICNDKSLPKMRPFDKVTLDLTWRRPTANEMKSRLMTIAHRESLKLDPNVIDQLVQVTSNDIRQIINILSTVSRTQTKLDYSQVGDIKDTWQKQVSLKPFEIIGRLLQGSIFSPLSTVTLNDKINLFFNDFDFTPLMVHENYRNTRPSRLNENSSARQDENLAHLELLSKAADSISLSDLVSVPIRNGEQQWSLLPFYGVMSSVLPCSYIAGSITGRINFSSWLGQNSKRLKYERLLQQLQYHSSLKTNTNNIELRVSYMTFLIQRLIDPLLKKGSDGLDEVIELLDEYYFTKEDWDVIMDFGVGKYKMDGALKQIPTAVKSQFTRKYNSTTHHMAIYKTGDSVSKRGATSAPRPDLEDVVEDDTAGDKKDEDDEEEGDLKKDKLIKEVKPKKSTAKSKGAASKAKTSRAKKAKA
ncbi:DNA binding protein [[Candida] boidinii]|nr:DNA binding protein [[Candida] boidinii]